AFSHLRTRAIAANTPTTGGGGNAKFAAFFDRCGGGRPGSVGSRRKRYGKGRIPPCSTQRAV
ncbi:hypothetical protein ABTE24_20670, partial [Acinetobacter baumannii]